MEFDKKQLENITLLYCEDEEDIRELTYDILSQFTKKVFVAKDGQEGLEIFKEHENEIDLIITDVNMPNLSGLEMAKLIKEINVNIPIIVATAFSNSSYLLESIELGIDKYILKPIDIRKLLEVLGKSLIYSELKDLYKDTLTHIPNRNALLRDLNKTNEDSTNTIAILDIDQFSTINELYGDKIGDDILVNFLKSVDKAYSAINCIIYRVGDDKFAVLSKDKNVTQSTLDTISQSFIAHLNLEGLKVENETVYFGVTVGIASSQYSNTYQIALRVLRSAKNGASQVVQYDKNIHDNNTNYLENQKWIQRFKYSLCDGEFQAYYQAIVDIKTNEIYKYEALIRYITERGEEISPAIFLPIAKKAKLFSVIIKLMIDECIKFIKEKKKTVSVNISFEDIKNINTYNHIMNKLKENIDIAHLLSFELLETEEIKDFNLTKKFINDVKNFGCQIGIDDFGAGYSNFNMLCELNVDFIKLDGSLISQIDTSIDQEIIVDTISAYAKRTNVKTIAEFVSDKSILNKIKQLDINYAQGYYYSKPVSMENV
jgi:diguanylate cyclase (GGDEF)-like protein